MQLFLSPTSPFGRIVLVGALNAGIRDLQLTFVDPWNNPTELQNLNPFSQIPTLITTGGHTLYDSFIIADYLLDHPIRGGQHAATLAFARILIEQSVKYFSLLRHQPAGISHPHIARAEAAIIRGVKQAPELQADSCDYAQLVLGLAFDYLKLRLPNVYAAHLSASNQHAMQIFTKRDIIRAVSPENLESRPTDINVLYASMKSA